MVYNGRKCYWQRQAQEEVKLPYVPRETWKECLVCDGEPPNALYKKKMFISEHDMNQIQNEGYTLEGTIKTLLSGDLKNEN